MRAVQVNPEWLFLHGTLILYNHQGNLGSLSPQQGVAVSVADFHQHLQQSLRESISSS
jgi:hypothetical protein